MTPAPHVEAHLLVGTAGRCWRVDRCPHCQRRHIHGAGSLSDDPRTFLGHRLGHCLDVRNQGYVLVDSGEPARRIGATPARSFAAPEAR